MVDFEAYREFQSGGQAYGNLRARLQSSCTCRFCVSPQRKQWMENFKNPQKRNEDLSGKDEIDNWLLLPYRLLGHAMEGGLWAQFPVENITDYIHKDQDAYDKVLFPENKNGQKATLRQLVRSHLSEKDAKKPGDYWVSDFIEGKGRGLVVLLHGTLAYALCINFHTKLA
jgi:hypothetical protein